MEKLLTESNGNVSNDLLLKSASNLGESHCCKMYKGLIDDGGGKREGKEKSNKKMRK
jgi:hypothetical protein